MHVCIYSDIEQNANGQPLSQKKKPHKTGRFLFGPCNIFIIYIDFNMQKMKGFHIKSRFRIFLEYLNVHSQMAGAEERWSPSEEACAYQFGNCPDVVSFIC